MNIDWDGVAAEANDSPRVVLAEALAHVDEMSEVIVISRARDGAGVDWASSCITVTDALGMLAFIQALVLRAAFKCCDE